MKKVFLVSWHFPPYIVSSGFNLFKRIKDSNINYDVVQIKRENAYPDYSIFSYASANFNRYEVELSSEDSRDESNREQFISESLRRFNELKEKNKYTAILTHSHEFVSHLVGLKIKEQYPDLQWFASFGDPISNNPYNKYYKYRLLEIDSENEKKVLDKADKVIVTNEYQKKIMSKDCQINAHKIKIVPHCYDNNMFIQTYESKALFIFKHIGMLYKHKRTAEPFIKALKMLINENPEYRNFVRMQFYGANDKYIMDAESGVLSGVVKYCGKVPYKESLKVMGEANCLLLRDADFTKDGYDYSPFYPGKLADYIASDKLMIAISMEKGFVADFFHEINMPCLNEENIIEIAKAMKAAIDGKIVPNYKVAKNYTTKKSGKIINELITQKKRVILFAGHDFKFATAIIDGFNKSSDYSVIFDYWDGHNKHDEESSRKKLLEADIIFCEWGLGNAVWYSNNKLPGQKMIVRIHLQEINLEYPSMYNVNMIDHFITISPFMYEEILLKYNFPRNKMNMIYNLVDTKKYDLEKEEDSEFNIAIIGFVPERKRLDRALDIIERLYKIDSRYKLYIKGKRPENYAWVRSRKKEMQYYEKQYKRIQEESWGSNVIFEDFSDNIQEFYKKIGFVVSVSDFESFHLVGMEGMSSGSVPVVINWEGSDTVYPRKYLFNNIEGMVEFIKDNHKLLDSDEVVNFPRKYYDKNVIFKQIVKVIES